MDNRRLILLTIFAFSIFMLWDGWTKHNAPPVAQVASSSAGVTASADAAIPQGQTVTYQATCPQGSVLVQTPSGKTSCSHASTPNLAVGDRNALSSDTFAELQEQVNRTGQPAAYTDGDVTIVLRPAP